MNRFNATSGESRAETPGSEVRVGCAPEGRPRGTAWAPWRGRGPPQPLEAPLGGLSRLPELSFHSLWARKKQGPCLLHLGVPVPHSSGNSTGSWEPPGCPRAQRGRRVPSLCVHEAVNRTTEPPKVRRAPCTELPVRPPTRPLQEGPLLNTGCWSIQAPVLWGGGPEKTFCTGHTLGKASAGDLPRGLVCPRVVCGKVPDVG